MLKTVLKGLAFSLGGGLALGAGIKIGQASVKVPPPETDLNPLLDRLEAFEDRIAGVEKFSAPTHEPDRLADLERKVGQIEVQVPAIVESSVGFRFDEIERRMRADFEDAQARSVDSLVQTLQTRVVQRISTLESNMAEQSEALGRLRETSLNTDENLQKLLAGVERLCNEPRFSAAPAEIPEEPPSAPEPPPAHVSAEDAFAMDSITLKLLTPEAKERNKWSAPAALGVLLAVTAGAGLYFSGVGRGKASLKGPESAPAPASITAAVPTEFDRLRRRATASPGDESVLMDLGREYVRRRDWRRGEAAFRSVLRAHPQNKDAVLALSDVLYQQQRYDESAAVLNKLTTGYR